MWIHSPCVRDILSLDGIQRPTIPESSLSKAARMNCPQSIEQRASGNSKGSLAQISRSGHAEDEKSYSDLPRDVFCTTLTIYFREGCLQSPRVPSQHQSWQIDPTHTSWLYIDMPVRYCFSPKANTSFTDLTNPRDS